MPKFSRNEFIEKHTSGYCLHFDFPDYKPNSILSENKKKLPSPGATIAKLASYVNTDYTIVSASSGKTQTLVVADKGAAEALQKKFNFGAGRSPHDYPCKTAIATTIDTKLHIGIAKTLGLL